MALAVEQVLGQQAHEGDSLVALVLGHSLPGSQAGQLQPHCCAAQTALQQPGAWEEVCSQVEGEAQLPYSHAPVLHARNDVASPGVCILKHCHLAAPPVKGLAESQVGDALQSLCCNLPVVPGETGAFHRLLPAVEHRAHQACLKSNNVRSAAWQVVKLPPTDDARYRQAHDRQTPDRDVRSPQFSYHQLTVAYGQVLPGVVCSLQSQAFVALLLLSTAPPHEEDSTDLLARPPAERDVGQVDVLLVDDGYEPVDLNVHLGPYGLNLRFKQICLPQECLKRNVLLLRLRHALPEMLTLWNRELTSDIKATSIPGLKSWPFGTA
ncbi:MAG: hypothetical protein FRX49_02747 [Trebouxia sp. A1-2]|nr:MAG: hypothetical protein FRX49_02747 [Trebouxia sp. A1-2]